MDKHSLCAQQIPTIPMLSKDQIYSQEEALALLLGLYPFKE